jgi:hypothetical protein
MAENPKNAWSRRNSSADFVIRFYPGGAANYRGKIEHVQSGQVQQFCDFTEMMLLIQEKLDQTGFPQSDTEMRSWPDSPSK